MPNFVGISTSKGLISEDENGVLRIGDTIIPQKKLLWSGNIEIQTAYPTYFPYSSNPYRTIFTSNTNLENKKLRITLSDGNGFFDIDIITRTKSTASDLKYSGILIPTSLGIGTNPIFYELYISVGTDRKTLSAYTRKATLKDGGLVYETGSTFSILKIYEVFE